MKPNLLKAFLIGFALVLVVCSQVPSSFAHSGDVLSAWAITTPTIDGVISAGEWIDADTADFTLTYCSESHDVTLHVKNDDMYLYLAVVVRDEEYSNLAEMYHDFANFYFDNDNDGVTDVGEDGLAIRFDNTIFRDTFNPIGVNGWSYSDADHCGTNDIDGATTHTNPVPDGVGDYTFEYRHPLNSSDDAHDFSLSAGDTVGFRFSFPDGETDCQPVGYYWPSSFPTSYGDIVIASEAYLKLLFVPLNWTNTQAAFDSQVDTQIDFFIDAIPLSACPEEIALAKLDVATQNFGTFTCTYPTNCGVGSIGPFVTGLGINTADYDIIVGLVENSPCSPIAGCSNGTDTIWVETDYDSVTAHEIGHIYGLEDEYCSNDAGSTDCRCNDGDQGGCGDTGGDGAATGDINHLHPDSVVHPCDCPPDGADDSTGDPCCNFDVTCGIPGGCFYGGILLGNLGDDIERRCDSSTYAELGILHVNYGICCLGNNNSVGGRAIMSFADVEDFSPGTRDYDEHSRAHFATLADLNCHSPEGPLSGQVIDLAIRIRPDDKVVEEKVILRHGRPTRYYQKGEDYRLTVVDEGGKVLWSQTFNISFDYNGPVYLGVDYSEVKYTEFPFSYRIPYTRGMYELLLYHKEEAIFSKTLDFCNSDDVCDTTETYLTCPDDCPLDREDKICIDRDEGICDPDCLEGVDPDCKGECGNGVCNINENFASCPQDCRSGGRDGYCDGEKDNKCDPDCKGEQDPDCRSKCGDGVCFSCVDAVDPYVCENTGNCPEDCPKEEPPSPCRNLTTVVVLMAFVILLLLIPLGVSISKTYLLTRRRKPE